MSAGPGVVLKMRTRLADGEARYELPVGDALVDVNALVGREVRLRFTGEIRDVATGEPIKKSYGDGYSYKSFTTLARCDVCMVRPELCHYERGTCREPEWGREHCLRDHVVYLAVTDALKVGITRAANVPSRWIDQGAGLALPILKVGDRLASGLVETELAKEYRDKSDWRRMLRGEGDGEKPDLAAIRDRIFDRHSDLLDGLGAEDLDQEPVAIRYPVLSLPERLAPLSLSKEPVVEGELLGARGQYLLFARGVLNVRRHQGHVLRVED